MLSPIYPSGAGQQEKRPIVGHKTAKPGRWSQAVNTSLLRIFHPVSLHQLGSTNHMSYVTARGELRAHLNALALAYWQDDLETSDQSQRTCLLKSTNMFLQRQACMLVWNASLLLTSKTVLYHIVQGKQ